MLDDPNYHRCHCCVGGYPSELVKLAVEWMIQVLSGRLPYDEFYARSGIPEKAETRVVKEPQGTLQVAN